MMQPRDIHLRVTTPTATVIDEQVSKVIAEAINGSFALLPRHADFVAPLAAGVLVFETTAREERFLGVDEGFLVKCGDSVHIATRRAAQASSLEQLRDLVDAEFKAQSAWNIAARSALARLEVGLIRRFVELERQS